MRTRDAATGPRSGVEGDDGAVALIVELLSYNSLLRESAPISVYLDGGVMRVWSYSQGTSALRQVAKLAGMKHKELSLHSLRIRIATVLGAGGDTSERVIQRNGRWKSGIDICMYNIYNRNNIVYSIAVSRKLTDAGKRTQARSGQGTSWGGNRP